MKFKKESVLFNVMLGAGLYLLDSMRERLADNVDEWNERARDRYSDFKDRAKDMYSTASERISRASDEITGSNHRVMSAAGAALIGAGVGFGLALLLAPASGEETRSKIAETMRSRFSDKKSA